MPKLPQRCCPYCKHAIQFGRRIGSVIPQVGVGMSAAQRPRIIIGDEVKALLLRFAQTLIELSLRLICVAVGDGDLIPRANTGCIGMRKIRLAVAAEGNERMRIIHHRRALAQRTGGEIVGESQRVTDLVRCKLAHARQHHGSQRVVLG